MPYTHRVAIDLLRVREADKKKLVTILAWGHPVNVVEDTDDDWIGIKMREGTKFVRRRVRGHDALVPFDELNLLRIDFADVQQGDGTLIETPSGKLILIDGGETHMFARYLAARFGRTAPDDRRKVDAVVVTHGDADHFAGLTEIFESETRIDLPDAKRLFMHPEHVFHNGLVKGSSGLPDDEIFGETAPHDGKTYVTDLAEDLRDVDDGRMNRPFKDWKKALEGWSENGPVDVRRLERGVDDAFDFLDADEDPSVEVLGPITTEVGGKPALPTLGDPGHTINGHSIVLRLTYGKWRLLFAGDLNEETEEVLASDGTELVSEVFKVPHHGSAEFTEDFLTAVAPVVSVISSGDDRVRSEHIHPRATLLAALGHAGRRGGVVFVTELVAFFESLGENPQPAGDEHVFTFRRTAYGIVRVRMSEDRLLVYTDSGKPDMKEPYVFVWEDGEVVRRDDALIRG
jgi:hypothetical protein